MQAQVQTTRMPNVRERELVADVREKVGFLASASLEAVLYDGAKRFSALSGLEESYIRQLAEIHEVKLPL